MKTIGLIGGMSWESTVPYYRMINEAVKETLGGLHSAKIILYSVEFDEIEKCQSTGQWDRAAAILIDAAQKLEQAGAELLVICTNTMHKVYPQLSAAVGIPILHIAEATAEALKKDRIRKVALLGTRYTMKEDFYTSVLLGHGLDVVLPDEEDIHLINRVIFEELCVGELRADSRREFSRVIRSLKGKGAQAVILGCTEIGLLIEQKDSDLPIYDTTVLHARTAVKYALADE